MAQALSHVLKGSSQALADLFTPSWPLRDCSSFAFSADLSCSVVGFLGHLYSGRPHYASAGMLAGNSGRCLLTAAEALGQEAV